MLDARVCVHTLVPVCEQLPSGTASLQRGWRGWALRPESQNSSLLLAMCLSSSVGEPSGSRMSSYVPGPPSLSPSRPCPSGNGFRSEPVEETK